MVEHKWVAQVEEALAAQGGHYPGAAAASDPEAAFITLDVAIATPAMIGRNLLGDRLYNRVIAELPEGDQLLFVGGRGLFSFKGTAWRKSGVFERLQLQGGIDLCNSPAGGFRRGPLS